MEKILLVAKKNLNQDELTKLSRPILSCEPLHEIKMTSNL